MTRATGRTESEIHTFSSDYPAEIHWCYFYVNFVLLPLPIYAHVCMHMRIYAHVYMHIRIYAHVYMYMRICVYICHRNYVLHSMTGEIVSENDTV